MAENVKSAERALQIIDLLVEHPRGLTFADVCAMLALPKSSGHALLATLVNGGYLQHSADTRTYRLGIRLWQAGQAFVGAIELLDVALPGMRQARNQLNETVQLAVLDGIFNVYIAKVDADQPLALVSRVGSRLPAYATGLGKVLLAGLTDPEVVKRLSGVTLDAFTPNTITDVDELLSTLATIRARGYGVDHSEYTRGVYCIARPIYDHSACVIAAISVSVPEVRNSQSARTRIARVLHATANEISTGLGFVPVAMTVATAD